jgi:type I restriction enzyme M protein
LVNRWNARKKSEKDRKRTDQSFLVPKNDIVDQNYDLSLNKYKEVKYEEVQTDPPLKILSDLAMIETEIQKGIRELEGMVK